MISNTSHISTFVIFIISINIVSVVCLFQPIKEVPKDKKNFLYFNYSETPSEPGYKKLDIDQFHRCYFNSNYQILLDDFNETYADWIKKKDMFCWKNYESLLYLKKMYNIANFGNIMNKLKKCLREECNTDFELLKKFFNQASKTESDDTCLGNLTEPNMVECCFNAFINELKKFKIDDPDAYTEDVLNTSETSDPSSSLIIPEDVLKMFEKIVPPLSLNISENKIGNKTKIAMKIATQNEVIELIDSNFKELISNYREYTGDKLKYLVLKKQNVENCYDAFKIFNSQNYNDFVDKYDVFRGLRKSFDAYSNQINITHKFLETMEGEVVNNKEIYDKYREKPISFEDYEKLLKPLPFLRGESYLMYSIRLKILEHVPFDEETWKDHISELKNTLNSKQNIDESEKNQLAH